MSVIRTHGLSRTFGSTPAVRDLALDVPTSSVYGFLGPNGAGKTTTIRMLLGLLRPTSGRIELFGTSLTDDRAGILRRVGSLVESPSLYLHLTGRENLDLARRLYGVHPHRVDAVLELVRLHNSGSRLVKEYSAGMKQRLGIALALLHEPSLLILDEPTNGLDPAGILDMRTFIRSLPEASGMTVFLSSHLLGEVEQIASHIGIIHRGGLLYQGTLQDLHASRRRQLVVEVDRRNDAIHVLTNHGWKVQVNGSNRLTVGANETADAGIVNDILVRNDLSVFHLAFEQSTLEDLFLHLTTDSLHALHE